jgi:peptide/nickel transport system permease protein
VLGYIARRIVAVVPVLGLVAVFVFLLLRLTPGDPAAVIAGDNANAQQVADIRTRLGLDEPIVNQFGIWAGRVLRGDLGESFFYKKSVTQLIGERLQPTALLALCAMTLSVAIAVPLGVIAAWRFRTWADRAVMVFAVLGFSVPGFVIAYGLIWVFALELGWLPVQGYSRIENGLGAFAERMVLPSVTLSVLFIAVIARITRASMLEVLGQDFVRTARAKGLGEGQVLRGHALRAAAVPIVTVIGIGVALLIGGTIVTESVYGIPGLGRLVVEAVLARDFPTIQGVILLFSVAYVLLNLMVDLTYVALDPRIRY